MIADQRDEETITMPEGAIQHLFRRHKLSYAGPSHLAAAATLKHWVQGLTGSVGRHGFTAC